MIVFLNHNHQNKIWTPLIKFNLRLFFIQFEQFYYLMKAIRIWYFQDWNFLIFLKNLRKYEDGMFLKGR